MIDTATRLSGWLLLLSLGLSIGHEFYPGFSLILCGLLYLCAAVFLFHRLVGIQKIQVLLLTVAGLLLMWASDRDLPALLSTAITANNALITLIISAGFLRLIIRPGTESETLPTGRKALWRTLAGAYVFSAVINLSAIVIFADRLLKKGKLHDTQIMVLVRTFGANAFWSPFFAAMGASLLYSGGARLPLLMLAGLCVALCSFILTGMESLRVLKRHNEVFEGYPMNIKGLILPVVLSVLVLIAHYLLPDISILILVASVVMGVVVVVLPIKHRLTAALAAFRAHVECGTVNSATELSLFLSAGLLAVGISAFAGSVHFSLPFENFTGYHAAFTLVCMVLVSLVGVHPVISISVLGGLLAPVSPDPDLLGLMFLFCWGIAIVASPLSGISLLFQSRYQIRASHLVRLNAGFTLVMLFITCVLLILYD